MTDCQHQNQWLYSELGTWTEAACAGLDTLRSPRDQLSVPVCLFICLLCLFVCLFVEPKTHLIVVSIVAALHLGALVSSPAANYQLILDGGLGGDGGDSCKGGGDDGGDLMTVMVVSMVVNVYFTHSFYTYNWQWWWCLMVLRTLSLKAKESLPQRPALPLDLGRDKQGQSTDVGEWGVCVTLTRNTKTNTNTKK